MLSVCFFIEDANGGDGDLASSHIGSLCDNGGAWPEVKVLRKYLLCDDKFLHIPCNYSAMCLCNFWNILKFMVLIKNHIKLCKNCNKVYIWFI